MILASVFLLLIFFIAINVPIAIAIGTAALFGMLMTRGFDATYNAALSLYSGTTSFPLIAIPLFILAGALMNTSSISHRLVNFCLALVGFVRGGLAMVNVAISLFFAEISGSAVADVACTGSVLIPAMKRRGFSAKFSAALTSSTASLAIIIPPSIPMILYAAISDTSVVQLFVAGVVPGLIGGGFFFLFCYVYAVRHNLPREEAFSLGRLWSAFKQAGWALTLPVIILGGIFGGFVTATEGAGLAVVAALVVGFFIYKDLKLPDFYRALVDGVVQTSAVMLLVGASAVLGLYLTEIQLPQKLTTFMTGFTRDPIVILMLINVLLFLLGTILHGAAAIILTVPVLMPLINELGIDPVHFGIILTLNIAIGQQTPPVASVLATACTIAKTSIWATTRVNLPMIGLLVTLLLLVTYVPAIPLSLVRVFF